jgi:hypothetical protein
LMEDCVPAGCARTTGRYGLVWRERGTEILIFVTGINEEQLLRFARSLHLVLV